MILVDTNVWSETLRQEPDTRVLEWLRAERHDLVLCVITVHELKFGVDRLPTGRRKEALSARIDALFEGMAQRVLAYDQHAARFHAEIRGRAERAGRGLSFADGQILGIAQAQGARIATRNTGDFEGHGTELINPWLA
ncbi:type II toxin-antitoxin system VapC family toxin [Leucobacter sp. Z1108]|uniref:type II toxin-antitoxin system VapC family toxin n=1 Tax=Leucobacter sp. Z1108 TaxID=3439066 RepID=UPI003F368218